MLSDFMQVPSIPFLFLVVQLIIKFDFIYRNHLKISKIHLYFSMCRIFLDYPFVVE